MNSKEPRAGTPIKARSNRIVLTTSICLFFFASAWLFYPRQTQPDIPIQPAVSTSFVCSEEEPVKNVAIIGAGSGGSSSAYYIRRFTRGCPKVNITIFERSSHIGGRSTTVNAHGLATEPVELGASIFVKVNHNLVSAVERLGLSTQGGFDSSGDDDDDLVGDLGVWDGSQWVYYQNDETPTWWTGLKLIWKYGLAPFRTRSLMKETVAKFLKMYSEPHFPFPDLSEKAYELDLTKATAATGEQFLAENNIGEAFSRDLIQASTRVNYAQNLDHIHGLETMVCMAAEGAMSVKGGNWKIFAGMVKSSGAKLYLNTSVASVNLEEDDTYKVTTLDVAGAETSSRFDAVILAGPYQFSNLTIQPEPPNLPPEIPYVNLHVTLFTSPFNLSSQLFNLDPGRRPPSTILTTAPKDGTRPASFLSISLLRTLRNPRTHRLENLYKIFSPEPLTQSYLHRLLNYTSESSPENDGTDGQAREEGDEIKDDKLVTWHYYKLWQSYPVELPRVTFDNIFISLDENSSRGAPGSFPGSNGIWYTSAIEPFISTMETSSLMGMNIARLIVDSWSRDKYAFDAGEPSIPVARETGMRDDL